MAADQMQVLDRPVLTDLRLQQHTTLDAGLPSQGGIVGRNFANQQPLSHALGHADALGLGDFGFDRGMCITFMFDGLASEPQGYR